MQFVTMIRQALILAGGRGTRLGSLTDRLPKPLMPVGGRPFLDHLLKHLGRHGVTDVVMSAGYLAEKIAAFCGDGSDWGVSLDYVVEAAPAGTGGAVRVSLPRLQDAFFVINGDTFFDIDLQDLGLLIQPPDRPAAMALRRVGDASRYGTAELSDGKVTHFREKSTTGPGLVNGGVYALHRFVVEDFPEPPCSIEHDVFPGLAARGLLAGRVFDGLFIDIGLPASLADAQFSLPAWWTHLP